MLAALALPARNNLGKPSAASGVYDIPDAQPDSSRPGIACRHQMAAVHPGADRCWADSDQFRSVGDGDDAVVVLGLNLIGSNRRREEASWLASLPGRLSPLLDEVECLTDLGRTKDAGRTLAAYRGEVTAGNPLADGGLLYAKEISNVPGGELLLVAEVVDWVVKVIPPGGPLHRDRPRTWPAPRFRSRRERHVPWRYGGKTWLAPLSRTPTRCRFGN